MFIPHSFPSYENEAVIDSVTRDGVLALLDLR